MSMPVLNSGAMTPDMARGENAQADLQARIMGLGNIGKKNIPPEVKAQKLREACEGFESIFIQRMWQEMRNTLPKEGLLHSREEHFWQDMYDQELAKKMSSAGGIGLADMMYAQLSRSLGDASRVAAGASRGLGSSNFSPDAAPLLQPQSAAKLEAMNKDNDQGKTEGKVASAAGRDSQNKPGSEQAGTRSGLRTLPPIYEGAAMQQGVVPSSAAEKQIASLPNPPGQGSLPAPLTVSSLAPVTAGGDGEPELANPEIEAALAQIRAQQAMNLNSQPAAQPAAQAALTPGAMNVPLPEPNRPQHNSQGVSGLELERIAKRQAGDKLGAGAVRPALQPRRNNRADNDNANNQQMAETAGASRHSRKVRYSTNIPANARNSKKDELIRTLTTDGSGPSSRAGQGIAAYHEQMVREGQNPAQNLNQPVMPQATQAMSSAQQASLPVSQPVQASTPVARQSANAAPPLVPAEAVTAVPPLTAGNQAAISQAAISSPAMNGQSSLSSQPVRNMQATAAPASTAELSSAWAMPLAAQPERIDNLPPQAVNAWQPKANRPDPARNSGPAAPQAGWTPAQTAMPRPGAMQTGPVQASPAAFAPLTPLTGASLQQPGQAGRQQVRQASSGIPPLTASGARS